MFLLAVCTPEAGQGKTMPQVAACPKRSGDTWSRPEPHRKSAAKPHRSTSWANPETAQMWEQEREMLAAVRQCVSGELVLWPYGSKS